jgi:hypothetical protein
MKTFKQMLNEIEPFLVGAGLGVAASIGGAVASERKKTQQMIKNENDFPERAKVVDRKTGIRHTIYGHGFVDTGGDPYRDEKWVQKPVYSHTYVSNDKTNGSEYVPTENLHKRFRAI